MATEFEEQLYEEHGKLSENEEDTDSLEVPEEIEEATEEADTETAESGETDQVLESEGEEKAVQAEDDTPLIPPHTWPEQYKADFAALPRTAQKHMLDMSKNMLNGFQRRMGQLGQRERELGGITQAVKSHESRLHRAGIDPATAVQRALAWDAHIVQNGPQGLLDMAKAYGYDLSQVQQSGNQEYLTPTERQLQQQVQSLTQAFQQSHQTTMQRQQQWQESQRQVHEQRVIRQLQDFTQEKGPDGKLKHPYVEHVANDMAKLLRAEVVSTLDEAYDIAAQRNPHIRAALDQQRKAAQVAELSRKADSVRKATTGVNAKSPDKRGNEDFESQLRAAYRKQA